MESSMDLKEKTAIVTGASEGLGRYLCTYFAGLGIKVLAIARNEEKLKALKDEAEEKGGTIETFAGSVNDYDRMKEAVNNVLKLWGKIDILVNNAGVGKWPGPIADQTKETIDAVVDTNFKGLIYMTNIIAPYMIEKKDGYMFNISSTAGLGAHGGYAVYGSTKAGVNGFSAGVGKELIKYNIHVVTLCPGGINTEWWDKWKRKEDRPKKSDVEELLEAKDIAELIKFILEQPKRIFYRQVIIPPSSEVILYG